MSIYADLSPLERRAADFQLAALQRMLVVRKARLPLSVLPAPASSPLSTFVELAPVPPVPSGAGVLSIVEHADA